MIGGPRRASSQPPATPSLRLDISSPCCSGMEEFGDKYRRDHCERITRSFTQRAPLLNGGIRSRDRKCADIDVPDGRAPESNMDEHVSVHILSIDDPSARVRGPRRSFNANRIQNTLHCHRRNANLGLNRAQPQTFGPKLTHCIRPRPDRLWFPRKAFSSKFSRRNRHATRDLVRLA